MAAPSNATAAPCTYKAGELGNLAPSAIDAAMEPGPVVRGKVMGKKLRRTMSTSVNGSAWLCATAARTPSSS